MNYTIQYKYCTYVSPQINNNKLYQTVSIYQPLQVHYEENCTELYTILRTLEKSTIKGPQVKKI